MIIGQKFTHLHDDYWSSNSFGQLNIITQMLVDTGSI